MKIAVPSTSGKLEDQVNPMFGRCPYFALVETKNKKIESTKAIKNTAVGQMGGAGITASQLIGNKGADAIIAKRLGPRAFDVMKQLDIEIYQAIDGNIKENIKAFLAGKLQKLTGPGQMGIGKPGLGRGRGRGPGAGRGRGQR